MSFAALTSRESTGSKAARSAQSSSGLRVGDAHDSFEKEAERVGEIVSSGGRISGLSLANMSIGPLRKQAALDPAADLTRRKGTGASLEDAFLSTGLGRRIASEHSAQAHDPQDGGHQAGLAGHVFAGPEATAAVEFLAVSQGGLPARSLEIALDRVHAGLRARISYKGPAQRPTHASVVLSHAGAGGHGASAPHVGNAAHAGQAAHAAHEAHGGHEPHVGHGAHAGHEPGGKREELTVQRRAADGALPSNTDRAEVESVVNGPGRPLDPATRSYMESRMGYDFGSVRVHTDARAAESAHAMGAQAYTLGQNVVFGSGRFAPETREGKQLLAHELTHVVQQGGGAHSHPVIRRAPPQIQRAPEDEGQTEEKSSSWFTNPIDKLKSVVRNIPGFRLFSVILGKDPLSDTKVERNATNVTQGVMELAGRPGAEAFERLTQSGALERAFNWLTAEIDHLGLTVDYFKGLIAQVLDSVSWRDVTDPAGALARAREFFRPAFEKLKKFALDALDKILEFVIEGVLTALGGTGVLEVLRKAGAVFKQIVKDPVGFLSNLVKAVGQGLTQFKDHILEHLKNGLVQWLFGEIAATGLKLPKRFDVAGVVGMVLDVLGLTYTSLRTRLVNMIGDTAVSAVEGAVDVVVAMKSGGLGAAWKLILEKADALIDTVMNSVRQWVVTKIVTTAVIKLAALFNPVGAVIQAIQAIYNTVTFFLEKAKQIAALAKAVLDSVAEIASGNITRAANYVEESMAKTVPVILGFLGNFIGLGGIGSAVRNIIDSARGLVDRAITKILDLIVGKAKELLGKGKEAVVQAVGWWKERRAVKVGGESHQLYMDGSEEAPKVMVASNPQAWAAYFDKTKIPADKEQQAIFNRCVKIIEVLEKPIKAARATDKLTKDELRAGNVEERRKLFNELATNVQLLKPSGGTVLPTSVIKYDSPRAEDGGGRRASASILSEKHPPGSSVADKPPIWTKLGTLTSRKRYFQGHLLNNNLGGEGRRFNLAPINDSANARHSAQVEEHVKLWVRNHRVVSYTVRAVYGAQPMPTEYRNLLAGARHDGGLSPQQRTDNRRRLREFEAEQNLPIRFDCEAHVLAYKDQQWVIGDQAFNANLLPGEVKAPIIKPVDTKIET
jgi:hypothetical protein